MKKSNVMTLDEAAHYLRVSRQTTYRLVEAGKIPARKVGHRWRISRFALEKYLDVPQAHERAANTTLNTTR